jgi:hypothetical protein
MSVQLRKKIKQFTRAQAVSRALFVLVMVRWQCVKVVGGVEIHVVYLINISGIKKKKKKEHYQSLEPFLSLLGAVVVEAICWPYG